jgi:di/tricarboxylate transporter
VVALEAWLTLAVILVALALFLTEAVTVDLTALVVMSLLLAISSLLELTGLGDPVVTPQEGIAGFANPATITILSLFILSAGIERTGLVDELLRSVEDKLGSGEFLPLLFLVLLVAPVSAFINNTAVVAILIPFAVELARERGMAPSRLLMPLSFASMLGGMVTLVGTSTNLLADAVARDIGLDGFTMFDFAAPGLIIAAVGMTYLLTVGRWLTPGRGIDEEERFNVKEFLGEVRVPRDSPIAGNPVGELEFPHRYGVEIVLLSRENHTIDVTPETIVEPGDLLLLLGTREDILEVTSLEHLTFSARDEAEGTPREEMRFYEVIVAPQSRLVGRTVRDAKFRQRYGGSVVAVRKGARLLQTARPIGRATLDVGDTLLVAGTDADRRALERFEDLILVEEVERETHRREKMPVALAVLAGVILAPVVGLVPSILVSAIIGAALLPLLGVLTMEEFHRSIRWDILFLLAGMIPLGTAMRNSGLSTEIANLITGTQGVLPPLAILMALYGLTTLLTNVMSNNASIILFAPIAIATARSLGVNPEAFLVAVMFAASTSFATPIGYQTNTMIYGPGGYKFSDYARVGLPLNLLLIPLAPWVITWFFPL